MGAKKTALFLLFISFTAAIACVADPSRALAETPSVPSFEQARWLFQHENFEEALDRFKQLKAEKPRSSEAAYYLGMTYKRLQDYPSARPYLVEAVTLEPVIEQALPELIDLLYQCDELDEAKKWIGRAEQDFVSPAQVAFFKGLVLAKEGIDLEAALKAFADARSLDASLAQAVAYQQGLIYTQMKDYRKARGIFTEIIVKDPATDLAGYANEYMKAIERAQDAQKNFRGSVGYAFQYDDNVVCKPNDEALSTSVSKEHDLVHAATAQAEYTVKPTDKTALKFGFSGYGSKHDDIGYYDVRSYDFPVQPVLYFEKASIALPMHFNYVSVNEERYMETSGAGVISNFMLGKRTMAQVQLQYNAKNYFWSASSEDERRDSHDHLVSAGWYRFFGSNNEGFVNVRYAANYEEADGRNWTYAGHRLTCMAAVPFAQDYKWNFVADYYRQDFEHDNTTYSKARHDNVVTLANLFSWEIFRDFELQLQHTFIYDGASIGVYKYKKNVYSIGTQWRF
ncbi:MAG: tetratricopeptide repeat protein [Candidatus Omnitrophica bacterium]|nr:tetratricopeptide repeat protein [Candidatus Omnitrophota bacterium]